ncbi:MAG: hypothetical protein AAGA01_16415 [Cyanobacteria bacterium P01_E01_bin.43]
MTDASNSRPDRLVAAAACKQLNIDCTLSPLATAALLTNFTCAKAVLPLRALYGSVIRFR